MSSTRLRFLTALAFWLATAPMDFAQHVQAFSFSGPNGASAVGDLVADSAGNLYGTSLQGGSCSQQFGCGVVFEFTPPIMSGGQWTETTIYTFKGTPDGSGPNGGLVMDSSGNLYGTTQQGGSSQPGGIGDGTVFELSPPTKPGGAWTETVIYSFGASPIDGQGPMASLITDSAGDLYGTTGEGGTHEMGTAFELSPPSQGGAWTETILYNFGAFQGDASGPSASLIFDSAGNLYGTTVAGGNVFPGRGAVFELSPPSQSGGAWTETILHSFGSIQNDGLNPMAAVTVTPSGALLGTASAGGLKNNGTVFALSPPSSTDGSWQYSVPIRFSGGLNGWQPESRITLLPGKNPLLYATTFRGGSFDQGVVYQLVPPAPGGSWSEIPVYNFTGGSDGGRPQGGVIVHGPALYGTTTQGGTKNCFIQPGCGTVFRLSQ